MILLFLFGFLLGSLGLMSVGASTENAVNSAIYKMDKIIDLLREIAANTEQR